MYTTYYIFVIFAISFTFAFPQPPELHSPPPRRYDRPGASSTAIRLENQPVEILRSVFEDEGNGVYHWAYENSDGTKAEQKGYIKNAGTENEIQVMEGSFTYLGSDGELYTTNYIADENGYQPTGAHLPK